jgi:hypothetical protein
MKEYKGIKTVSHEWSEVRDQVQAVNPEFSELIDSLDPGPECRMFEVVYSYGDKFIDSGEFYLPGENGELIPFTDSRVEPEIQEALGYNMNTNPVTIVLENTIEMLVTLEDRIVPFGLRRPGDVFGAWRTLDKPNQNNLSHSSVFMWDMTAGARSMFMLPKISEAVAHNKLKQAMHIGADKPRDLLDHWKVFRALAKSPDFGEPWQVKLLFMSREWFEKMYDPAWIKLRSYFLNRAWHSTEFWRNQFVWNLTFARIQSIRNIKAASYIADIVKHILAIGSGAVPGFRPALDSSLGPVEGLQRAYIDHYELKTYAPIIMEPSVFHSEPKENPAYYSLQFPSALELSPKTSGRSSAISDLYDIRALLNKYMKQISSDGLNIEATPLYELSRTIHMDYYHNNVDLYEGMKHSEQLCEDDPAFAEMMRRFPGREFPKNSAFVKGVISVHS